MDTAGKAAGAADGVQLVRPRMLGGEGGLSGGCEGEIERQQLSAACGALRSLKRT